jgi:hypothetical protein
MPSLDYSSLENMWDARNMKAYTTEESYHKYRAEYAGFFPVGMRNIWWVQECDLVWIIMQKEDP